MEEKSDSYLFTGRVFTAARSHPWAEAVVVHGGRIAYVGTAAQARRAAGSKAEIVDLKGRLLLPAFGDSHVHFADGGFNLLGADLRRATCEREMALAIRAAADKLEPGEWVTGGYWDHEAWPGGKLPTKDSLDAAGIDRPVFVRRVDTHIALANGIALRLAGIGRGTADPPGGEIRRDPDNGEPTGILADAAIALVEKAMPRPGHKRRRQALLAAQDHANRLGIAGVNDNAAAEDLQIYQELHRESRLTVRVNAMRWADAFLALRDSGVTAFFGDGMLRLGTIKVFADGSFGAATALLHSPYCDAPGKSGLAIYEEAGLARLLAEIDAAGLQIAVHAIGDRAVSIVLDALQEMPRRDRADRGEPPVRHRIEHAQMVRDADLDRFRRLGVVLSLQPSHCLADMRWAEKRIGERSRTAYRLSSFLERGNVLAFGSDWPVETLDPLYGIYAAVTRRLPDGSAEWFPEEGIALAEAVTAYTLGSALAEGQEGSRGTIEPGKLADLVVLDRDVFQLPAGELLAARVDLTFLEGRPVFRR